MLAGCGQILGLGDYEVGETTGSGGTEALGGTGGTDGGSGGDGGSAGSGGSNGGGAGGSDGGSAGTAGTAGAGTTASGGTAGSGVGGDGSTSTTTTTTMGTGGSAGAPPCECDERNPCLTSECEAGQCVPEPLGTECLSGNFAGVCDDAQQCVPCVDDADESGTDSGCPETAPECDDTGATPECTGCSEDIDCDDGIDCTTDTCDDGRCLRAVLPVGAECSEGVCNGAGAADSCVTCVDNQATGLDAGCEAALPLCDASQDPAVCVECLAHADCDDQNDCTSETCESKQCAAETVPAGEECLGGICSGIPGMESCGACRDTAAGDEVDQGCEAGAPVCDMSQVPPVCTGCTDNTDCDDEIECTTDTCNGSQVCVHTPDDGLCTASADVCMPNQCIVGMGCTAVDVTQSQEVLADAAFDAFTTSWTESASTPDFYDVLIVSESGSPPAHSSPRFAWLGGAGYEFSELSQIVSLPEGTQSLTLAFYYYLATYTIPYDNYNIMGVDLRSADGGTLLHEFQLIGNQDGTNGWTPFEATVDATDWAGSDVMLYFWASIGAEYLYYYGYPDYEYQNIYNSNYFVDTTSLTATVCQ